MDSWHTKNKPHDKAPDSPTCISTVFPTEELPELHLGGNTTVIVECNAAPSSVTARWMSCSLLRVCTGVAFAIGFGGYAFLWCDCTSSGILAVDLAALDFMCMVFNSALIVGIVLNLYQAFHLNRERCAQARTAKHTARAQWRCHNTRLSPAEVSERRRLLVQVGVSSSLQVGMPW